MGFDYRHLLRLIDIYVAMIPTWLQVVLAYYLAIVLTGWARSRLAAKKRLLPAVIAFAIAAALTVHATSLVMAILF